MKMLKPKMKNKKTINNEEELINLGIKLAYTLKPQDIIFLNGPLGAGKTTFVKGIAKGLGINSLITSPTFQIAKQYNNKLCHIDAYRIHNEDIGIEEYKENNYIICVEWAENLPEYIIPNYIINIDYLGDKREMEIQQYE